MAAPAGTLTPFKIAVAGGSATLTGGQAVFIHTQAHRAAGFTPLKPRLFEHPIQAFGLGLSFDQARAWHDQGQSDVAGNLAALHHGGGGAQVFNARIGARADEHFVNRDLTHRCAGLQVHIAQGVLHALAAHLVGLLCWIGHMA